LNPIERAARRIDGFQQRHGWLGFPLAVTKKFGDDQAGNLAALLAYYGLFSLFPLLMAFVSVLGILLKGQSALTRSIEHSALSNFPVIGDQISKNVHSLGSGAGLAIGIVGALWGGIGVVQTAQNALNLVWNIPKRDWPNFFFSRLRSVLMLAILGTIVIVSTFLSSFGASGHAHSLLLRVGGSAGSLTLNFALYLLAFQVLTARQLRWSEILPGTATAAVLWTILQSVGGYILTHEISRASNTYGTFALVIGLLVWIYLGAQVTLYCAELNVVWVQRLWPRSLVQPPLTEADERVYGLVVERSQMRPEQSVEIAFEPSGRTADAEKGGAKENSEQA
jgi:YihY family inner membrane protein